MVLLVGLALVQAAGLTIHAFDRMDLQRLAQARNVTVRVMALYRSVVMTTPDDRDLVLQEMRQAPGMMAELSKSAPVGPLPEAPPIVQRMLRVNLDLVPMPPRLRPAQTLVLGGHHVRQLLIGLRMPDGEWLNVTAALPPLRPWHSPTFLWAFVLMTLAAAALTLWAVRRLTAPVRTLAAAAEALGRDVNAPPLPEERTAGGRHRRSGLQLDGRAHPPFRAGPHGDADRDRP